ncbi:PQQ-binding-like beta-propeller repeat protein [Naumannella cuiyingiana]|nr:PQQ-binding-like beta-propeller repeat protein [Naumannella cuiyingiana]
MTSGGARPGPALPPPPPFAPPVGPPARRRSRAGAVLVVLSLVVAAAISATSIIRLPVLNTGGDAEAYLPEGESLTWLAGGPHPVSVQTQVRTSSAPGALGPPEFKDTTGFESMVSWTVTTSIDEQVPGEPDRTLGLRLMARTTDDGLRLGALRRSRGPDVAGDGSFRFEPGVLELPADVVAGSAWVTAGDVYSGERPIGAYRLERIAEPAPELGQGCLRVRTTGDLLTGAMPWPIVTEGWCAGRGRVELDAGGGPLRAAPRPDLSMPSLPGPEVWPRLNRPRDVIEGTVDELAPIGPEAVAVATVDTPGLTVRRRSGEGWSTAGWLGIGQVVSLVPAGGFAVAATLQRRLWAVDGFGRPLWVAELPDLPADAPQQVGSAIVVTTLDGSTSALDRATGRELWRTETPDAVRMAVADGVVAVAAEDRMEGFALADGTPRWRIELGDDNPFWLIGAGDRVLVANRAGVSALDPITGNEVWSLPGYPRAGAAAAGIVVVAGDELVTAVAASDGAERWRAPVSAASALAMDADGRVLVGAPGGTRLIADGSELVAWPELAAPTLIAGPSPYLIIQRAAKELAP